MALLSSLAACGGDGGDAAPAPTTGTLFLTDATTGELAVFPTLVPAANASFDGQVAATLPAFSVAAPHQLQSAQPLAYDGAHDELFVGGMLGVSGADSGTVTVRVFSNASRMGSGAVASRVIETTSVDAVRQLFYDAGSDTLTVIGIQESIVPGFAAHVVAVRFAHASTASGTDPATAPLVGSAVFPADGFEAAVALDSGRDVDYVTRWFADDRGGSFLPGVAVLANASTAPATPTRMIASASAPNAIALDAGRDLLYVADAQGVWLVQHASTASPTTIGPIALSTAESVAVDSGNDRLYVGANQKLYVFERASTLTAASSVPAASVVDAAGTSHWIAGIAFE